MSWQVFQTHDSDALAYIVDREGYLVSAHGMPRAVAYELVRAHNRELDVAAHNAKIESSAAVRATMKG